MSGAGGLDWLAIWREMYERERAQAEARDRVAPPADCWEGQAGRLAVAWRRNDQPDGFMRFLLPHLRPGDRVLDIGAGTGRYARFLADQGVRVTALEPSPAMYAHLAETAAEAGPLLEPVAGSWPATAIAPAQVALAANVLYGVSEVAPFLQRMDDIAERACFVALALRHPSSYISPFWQRFYGEPRLPLPGALECLNALHQLGLPAQLALVPRSGRVSFATRDEALADIRWRLRMAPSPEGDAAILAAIDELLLRDADGRYLPPDQAEQTAVIWWEK